MEFRDSGKKKGPVCGQDNCRSRVYEEGEDGYLYCQNGHRKGDLVIGEDEGDYTNARRQTTKKKQDDEDLEKRSKYFKGQKAIDLYLKSLQLILRHQIRFLLDKGLPNELETVVLDLWVLRILQQESRIGRNDQGYSSQTSQASASEDESEPEGNVPKPRFREQKLTTTPTLIDCIALLYLGIITLRLPVTSGDILQWIKDCQMPYTRAILRVPIDMRDRLPANYHSMLDPPSILTPERFFATVDHLKYAFKKEYGVVWPPLNHPLLIYRLLKDLALPLELYDATLRLAGYIDYDFKEAAAAENKGNEKESIRSLPEAQILACLVVCVKLMYPFDDQPRYPKTISEPAATAIDWDAWCTQYSSSQSARANETGKNIPTYEQLMNMHEKDVFDLEGEQLDAYLDWYHLLLVDDHIKEPDNKTRSSVEVKVLYRYRRFKQENPGASEERFRQEFSELDRAILEWMSYGDRPVDRSLTTRPSKLDFVKALHRAQRPRQVVGEDDGDVPRPGMNFKHYKRVEDLPEQGKRFYEAAAKVGGLSLDMLVLAVFFAEKKMGRWQATQLKGSRRRGNDS